MDTDPLMRMSPYTNTILARQCMYSDKLLEKCIQLTVPKFISQQVT